MPSRILSSVALAGILLAFSGTADVTKAAPLTPIETLLIERDCEALSMSYAHAQDTNDVEAFTALFAEDGVWDLTRVPPFKGRAAVHEHFAEIARERSPQEPVRHVITNVRIKVIDETRATGTAYMSLYHYYLDKPRDQDTLHPATIVTFNDEYVRTKDGWRFKSRKSVRIPGR